MLLVSRDIHESLDLLEESLLDAAHNPA
jgi:hypothetical protein